MRTTVTIDRDVERMLREFMHRSRKGFKEALNDALRSALGGGAPPKSGKRFVVEASPMGLLAGIDPAGLNKLADDLEIDAFLDQQGKR